MAGQPTRFYGLALGKEKNFNATTDGLATESDTTPSVATKSLLYTNNTTATVITNFDDGQEGQLLTLIMLDSNTTINPNASIAIAGTGSFTASNTGSTISFINHNGIWYETGKGVPSEATNVYEVVTLADNNSAFTVNNDYKIVSLLCSSGGVNLSFLAFSGGYIGQTIFMTNNSDGKTVRVLSGGNLMIEGTNSIVINNSAMLTFIKGGNGYWYAPRGMFVA